MNNTILKGTCKHFCKILQLSYVHCSNLQCVKLDLDHSAALFAMKLSADHFLLSVHQMLKLAGGGGRKGRKKKQEDFSLQQMVDISENQVKDTVKAYQKFSTEEHSHTSGTVVSSWIHL